MENRIYEPEISEETVFANVDPWELFDNVDHEEQERMKPRIWVTEELKEFLNTGKFPK